MSRVTQSTSRQRHDNSVYSHVFSVCWSLPSRRCSICLGSSTVAVVCPSSLGTYCIPLQVSWAPSKDRQNCRLQSPTITRTQYTHCLCPDSVLRALAQFNDGINLNPTIIRKHNDIISTKTWSSGSSSSNQHVWFAVHQSGSKRWVSTFLTAHQHN